MSIKNVGQFITTASTDGDLAEKLKNSEELRSAMGSAGRKTVEEHYSQEAIAARVVSLIDNISASKISTA